MVRTKRITKDNFLHAFHFEEIRRIEEKNTTTADLYVSSKNPN